MKPGLEVALADLRLALPARRRSVPQPQQNGTVTRAPTAQPRTAAPTAATTPQSSWPGHVRQRDRRIVAHPAVPVAAADAGGADRDDDAVGRGRPGPARSRSSEAARRQSSRRRASPYCRGRGPAEPAARRAAPARPPRLGPAGRPLGGARRAAADRRERPGLVAGERSRPAPTARATRSRRSTRCSTRSSRAASARTTRASSPASAARATRSACSPTWSAAATTCSPAAGPAAPGRRRSSSPCSTGCASGWGCPTAPRACSSAAARSARSPRWRPPRTRAVDDRDQATAYVSEHTHAAIAKAWRMLGFNAANLRVLRADPAHRLQPAAVEAALRLDREAGLEPFVVVATAGTTSTGSVDPLADLADLAEREGLWFHVDGAYGAPARLTPAGKDLLTGIERADSLVLDPHKWLFQPYEIGCGPGPRAGRCWSGRSRSTAPTCATPRAAWSSSATAGPAHPRLARAEALAVAATSSASTPSGPRSPRDRARRARRARAARARRLGGRRAGARSAIVCFRRTGADDEADGRDGARRRSRTASPRRARRSSTAASVGAAVHDQSAHHRARHRATTIERLGSASLASEIGVREGRRAAGPPCSSSRSTAGGWSGQDRAGGRQGSLFGGSVRGCRPLGPAHRNSCAGARCARSLDRLRSRHVSEGFTRNLHQRGSSWRVAARM